MSNPNRQPQPLLPQIAQVPFPIAQVPFLTAQVTVPTAQEPLNLSTSPNLSLNTNATLPTTSASLPEKTTPQLEPFEATPGSGVDCANPLSTPIHDNRNRLPIPSTSQSDSSPAAESPAPLMPSSPPEPSAHLSLNMSAPPSTPLSTTDVPPTPCDQPATTLAEKSFKHERSTHDPISTPSREQTRSRISAATRLDWLLFPVPCPVTALSSM